MSLKSWLLGSDHDKRRAPREEVAAGTVTIEGTTYPVTIAGFRFVGHVGDGAGLDCTEDEVKSRQQYCSTLTVNVEGTTYPVIVGEPRWVGDVLDGAGLDCTEGEVKSGQRYCSALNVIAD